MTYRWRVVSPLAPLRDQVRRLADATAAAESFLLAGSDTGDVAVVFGDQPGAVPEGVPQVVGLTARGRPSAVFLFPLEVPCAALQVPARLREGRQLSTREPARRPRMPRHPAARAHADDLGNPLGHGPRLVPEHDSDVSRVRAGQEERLSGGSGISQPPNLIPQRGERGHDAPAVRHAAARRNARTTFPPCTGCQSREAEILPAIIRPRPDSSSAVAIFCTGGSAN